MSAENRRRRVPWRRMLVVPAVVLATAACAATAPTGGATVAVACANADGDAARLNDAVARSVDGSEIVISGTCLMEAPLRLMGDRSYRGTSRTGTVLRQADGADLPAVAASASFLDGDPGTGRPLSIRDLTLDGNRNGNVRPTDGLVLRSWQSVAEGLRIVDVGGSGIRVTNTGANGTTLTSTQVNGRIAGSFIVGSGKHGILVEDSGNAVTDWQLIDNWIADSVEDGISMQNAAGWIVARNHLYGVGHTGIWANRLYGTTISDNYVEGFGEVPTPATWSGIGVTVQGDSGSTIAGNRVFTHRGENPASAYRYIAVVGVNYGEGVLAVTGNVVRGVGSPGSVGLFYAADAGRVLTVSSGANVITAVGSPVQVVGDAVRLTPGR